MSVIEDDLDEFYDLDEFAASADFVVDKDAATPVTVSINVLFYNEFQAAALLSGEVAGQNPMIRCKSADVTGVDNDSTFTVDSVLYYVRNIHPNGTGEVIIELSRTDGN